MIDPREMLKRNLVNREKAVELIKHVTKIEIDNPMFSINDVKCLGLDGYNAKIFNKC